MIPNIRFRSCGHFTSRTVWRHPTLTIPTWEFIYMIDGEACLYEGGRHFTLKSGDVALFAPNIEHGGFSDSINKVSFIWFHIFAEDAETEKMLSALPRVISSVKTTEIPMMARQLLHRANYCRYSDEMRVLTAKVFVMEYERLGKEREESKNGVSVINAMREWIRINSDRKLTVAAVAEKFGYNRDYLTRFFKKSTGMQIKSFIDEMRISTVKTQLMTTEKPLKIIAAELGFEDYKAFLKFFTYHAGQTPTEFRESCYMTRQNNV